MVMIKPCHSLLFIGNDSQSTCFTGLLAFSFDIVIYLTLPLICCTASRDILAVCGRKEKLIVNIDFMSLLEKELSRIKE